MSAESTSKRIQVSISGIVQGVGFRPFIYQLAQEYFLAGFVFNNAQGVVVEVEGKNANLLNFLKSLKEKHPPLSRIDSIEIKDIPSLSEEKFFIRDSHASAGTNTMVSPDIAVCDNCISEMQDKKDRRYKYPFINCTDCGPRYTIINQLPYDRKYTSMSSFEMCPECKTEYENPNNRRYHAQPISCSKCGPRLSLIDLDGKVIAHNDDALSALSSLIISGKIVALKGLGGFHIVCDARNTQAVDALRKHKKRPSKPLAVMFKDIQSIKEIADLSDEDEELILSKEKPIVIVSKNSSTLLCASIAPNINRVGVFVAYTPLHILLLQMLNFPIVATSANFHDEPIMVNEKEVVSKLGSFVSAVLSYDRKIVNACDDSVVMMAGQQKIMLRMARGYAPKSLHLLQKTQKKILAVGANQKSTLALAFDENIVLSPHIGDLNSLDSLEYFERTIETFQRFYNFEPDIVVCDKHPNYETTKWTKEFSKKHPSVEVIEVQHHYAHALACMAEYALNEKVLAFCFDGTGYGDDGSLWGGEVLIADPYTYERVYNLKPFRLIGADKAVKEPRRVALSLLFECFSLDEVLKMDNATVKSFTNTELNALHKMHQNGINSPWCSSIGRLFDAVASLGGISQVLGYEGEGGLLVETQADTVESSQNFTFLLQNNEIDYRPMIREILSTADKNEIASRFISTISYIILQVAQMHPKLPVVLSGGVFQNKLLVEELTRSLKSQDREYYIQKDTPVNDGSVSLGQIYHALYVSKGK